MSAQKAKAWKRKKIAAWAAENKKYHVIFHEAVGRDVAVVRLRFIESVGGICKKYIVGRRAGPKAPYFSVTMVGTTASRGSVSLILLLVNPEVGMFCSLPSTSTWT